MGIEKFEELAADEQAKLLLEISIDQTRYKGLHGTAILGRFALENVRLQPFEHQPHDWYKDELKSVRPLEAEKRKARELIFQEKVRSCVTPEASTILVPKEQAELAMDAAACIGYGACVAACPNGSASLFTSAKIAHLNLLPQGQLEGTQRAEHGPGDGS